MQELRISHADDDDVESCQQDSVEPDSHLSDIFEWQMGLRKQALVNGKSETEFFLGY